MLRVGIFSSSRADWSIFSPLIKALNCDDSIKITIFGFAENGVNYHQDALPFHNVNVRLFNAGFSSVETRNSAVNSYTNTIRELLPAIQEATLDGLIVLGDRFETLAAATTAYLLDIRIIHMHGGELTHGSHDDSIRHAISKLSDLHLTSHEDYALRLSRMGERQDKIAVVGALGINQLLIEINGVQSPSNEPFILVTFHPVTNHPDLGFSELEELLHALETIDSHHLIFTGTNQDPGGQRIWSRIIDFISENPLRRQAILNLGPHLFPRYLSHCDLFVGNSSAGLIEAPSLAPQVINIGHRQLGRLSADSVVHELADRQKIKSRINEALAGPSTTKENPFFNANGPQLAARFILDNLPTTRSIFEDPKP